MKNKQAAAKFCQGKLNEIREALAKSGHDMPQFDDKTAALAISVFAKLAGDEKMLKAGKKAMVALA